MATKPTLKAGASGPAVVELQQLLAAAGFSVPASGVFDAATGDAVRAFQTAKGLVADEIVGPKTWAALQGLPAFTVDKQAGFGREVLESIWTDVTGLAPTLAELQIAGAQAHLESNYGLAQYTNKQTGQKSGVINNWGAVQGGGSGPKGGPPCEPGAFEASDTHADGSSYNWCYKRYATPQEGAKHFLQHITVKRPTAWDHMKRGDIDAYCYQLRHPATGPDGKKEPLYFEAPWEKYAAGLASRVVNIAGTLGEPVAAKRGGPVDPATALGQTPDASPGWFDGLPAQRKASVGVIALGLAALAGIVGKWGWPWTWKV